VKELLEILDAMSKLKGEIQNPQELFLDMADRVVKYVAQAFSAKSDEVAILVLTTDQKHLRFAAPRKFLELGTIPINKRDSIAVTVFSKKTGELMNNVPMVKHVSFFESVKLRDKVLPIQKMVTVPILDNGTPVGVGQISRKGESPAQAGPDFTQADLRRAQDLFEQVGPRLFSARPERF
jgi:hypothetical protein